MKKIIKKIIKKTDYYLSKIYKKVSSFIIGKAIFRLFEGLILALLIASISTLFSQIKYNYTKNIELLNSINSFSIGANERYIDDFCGQPKYSYYYKEDEINEKFYIFDGLIIRGLFKDQSLVAYFITLTDKKQSSKINIKNYNHLVDDKKLGNFSYKDINGMPNSIVALLQNGTGYGCYIEEYYFASSGNYKGFIFCNLPYGLISIESISNEEFVNDEEVKKAQSVDVSGVTIDRSLSFPSTYGIFGMNITSDEIYNILLNWSSIDYNSLINEGNLK